MLVGTQKDAFIDIRENRERIGAKPEAAHIEKKMKIHDPLHLYGFTRKEILYSYFILDFFDYVLF